MTITGSEGIEYSGWSVVSDSEHTTVLNTAPSGPRTLKATVRCVCPADVDSFASALTVSATMSSETMAIHRPTTQLRVPVQTSLQSDFFIRPTILLFTVDRATGQAETRALIKGKLVSGNRRVVTAARCAD